MRLSPFKLLNWRWGEVKALGKGKGVFFGGVGAGESERLDADVGMKMEQRARAVKARRFWPEIFHELFHDVLEAVKVVNLVRVFFM